MAGRDSEGKNLEEEGQVDFKTHTEGEENRIQRESHFGKAWVIEKSAPCYMTVNAGMWKISVTHLSMTP